MYRYNAPESLNQEAKYKIFTEILSYIGKSSNIDDVCRFVCNNVIRLGFSNCIIQNQLDGKTYANETCTDSAVLLEKITEDILKRTQNGYQIIDMGYSSYRIKLGKFYVNRIKRNNIFSGYLILTSHNSDLFQQEILSLMDTLTAYLGVCFENKNAVNIINGGLYKDELTGLYNRKYLEELKATVTLSDKHLLSFILIDIDKFKEVNDTYGHPFGDLVLRGLSDVLKAELSNITDSIIRFGGEEILIVLPERDIVEAAQIAERVRISFNNKPFATKNGDKYFSVSLGLSTSTSNHDFDRILEQADISLYIAKRRGRNCLVQYTDEISAKRQIIDSIHEHKRRSNGGVTCYKIELNLRNMGNLEPFDGSLDSRIRQCFKKDVAVYKIGQAKYIIVTESKLNSSEIRDSLSAHIHIPNLMSNFVISGMSTEDGGAGLEKFIELV